MTKFSDFIRTPGTAGPPTRDGISALGFALRVELEKYLWLGGAQSFTPGEKTQGRANLGVAIGADVQAYSASLSSLAGLTTAADQMPYTTASNTWAVTTLTAFARTILDDTSAGDVRVTIGLGNVDDTSDANKPISSAQQAALDLKADLTGAALTAPTLVSPLGEFLRGHITGLTLSNNGTDATNDIDIAAGSAGSDGTTPVLMTLASALTKRLDAAWTVGDGNGGLDTGSIANTTYHVWLIQRSDTGVVDVLFSTSATSPTMPANYDRKRRIGSIIRIGGAILPFRQSDDIFLLDTPTYDINLSAGIGTTATTPTLTVPSGIVVEALISGSCSNASNNTYYLITSPLQSNIAATSSIWTIFSLTNAPGFFSGGVLTNTSAQIRLRASASSSSAFLQTRGWIDRRV